MRLPNRKRVGTGILVLVSVLFVGIVYGYLRGSAHPTESTKPTENHGKPVDEADTPREIARPGREPDRIIIREVRWDTSRVRDTLRVEVPGAIARDTLYVRLARQNPVTISTPIFGRQTVRFSSYNFETGQYETQEFRVPEPATSYGVSVEGYRDLITGASGAAAEVYVGVRGMETFARMNTYPSVVAGVRYRWGR